MTDRAAAADWVRRYVLAWDSNEPDDIRALFADAAEYRFHPAAPAHVGVEAIVEAWLEAADAPGDHTFEFEIVAVDGATAVIQGLTRYSDGDAWHNLWVVALDDSGRATSFTEWFMEPDPPGHD